MENIEITLLPDDKLQIVIDLSQDLSLTRGGGNVTVASTRGNVPIWCGDKPHPRGVKLNVNVFRPLTTQEKAELAARGAISKRR